HPETGEILHFSQDFLARLVHATSRWIELGNKVWFPAGHSSDPRDNLGFWSGFELEGDRVVGVLEVQDKDAAGRIGKTIQDVSAAIWWDARASSGETFEAVLEHVCGTPCPVIPGQTNFVRLAREAFVKETEKGEPEKKPTELAKASDSGAGLDLGAAIKLLVGLPQDAQEQAVIDAVRALCLSDDDDEGEDEAKAELDDEADGEAAVPGATLDPAGLATLSV